MAANSCFYKLSLKQLPTRALRTIFNKSAGFVRLQKNIIIGLFSLSRKRNFETP
jgi:hypothetical protein